MSALLLKDIYMLKKYCRSVLLMIIIFWGVAVIDGGSNPFWVMLPVIIGSVTPATLLSYDEKFRWNLYCDTMPLSRECVVAEKYVLTAAVVLLLTFGSAAVRLLAAARGGEPQVGLAISVMLTFLIGLLPPAIMIPAIYKYGMEKGRIIYYFCIGAACAVSFGMPSNVFADVISAGSLYLLLTVSVIALLAVSWAISTAIYKKKSI